MNPVAYMIEPDEPLYFLLFGELVHYRDEKESERIWNLNIYVTPKSRQIAAKKMKRGNSDIIFIEWDVTMEQIVKQGEMIFPMASEKVPCSDKADIWDQLYRAKR